MKSVWVFFIFIAFATGSAQQAHAQDKDGTPYSYYLISCGSFIHHRESGEPNDSGNTADTFYVAGWVSSYNRLKPASAIPEDTTLDDVMLWLEEYCTEHPLSNLEAGLFALSEEVKPRNSQPAPVNPVPAPKQAPIPAPPTHTPVPGLKPLAF